jgi:acyl-CoA thioester hydrolase
VAQRYVTDVRVRYSDLDAQGHVNNARVLTLLEEARVDWLYTDAPRHGADQLVRAIVVASLDIQYKRPIIFGPPARVSLGVSKIGKASFTVDYVVTSDDVVTATASTVLVPVELADGKPRRLGDRRRDQRLGQWHAGEADRDRVALDRAADDDPLQRGQLQSL